jgi:hypothetical protein
MSEISKKVALSYKIDNTEFNQSIEHMKRKISEVNNLLASKQTAQRGADAGIPGVSKTTQEAFAKSGNQTKRDMEQVLASEFRAQEKLGKEIAARNKALDHSIKLQEKMTKGTQEEAKHLENIQKMKSTINRQQEQYGQRSQMMNQMMNANQQLGKATAPPGWTPPNGTPTMGQGAPGGGGMMGSLGTLMNMIPILKPLAIAKIATDAADFALSRSRVIEQAQGSTISQTVSRDLERRYSGQSVFDKAFLPQRQQAEDEASDEMKWRRVLEKGTFGVAAMGTGRFKEALFAGLGEASHLGGLIPGGEAMQTGYNAQAQEGQAESMRARYAALQAQHPELQQAMDRYGGNYRRDLGTQRGLGMSDDDLYGNTGFVKRGHGAGFMEDQMHGMGAGILGAGGSSRMGQRSEFGLQMERGGLTNSPGILGQLSGAIQSPEAVERTTKRIMEESFKAGLDNSDFAEENRRFTQAAASIISSGAAGDTEGQARMANLLASFMGERTNKGVESARNAYEEYQKRESDVSGRRGTIRMSMAQTDPTLKNLDPTDLTELMSARPDQLDDPAFMAYFAKKTKNTPEKIKAALDKGNEASRFMNPELGKRYKSATGRIADYLTKNGLTMSEFTEKARNGQLGTTDEGKDILATYGEAKMLYSTTQKEGIDQSKAAAYVAQSVRGEGTQFDIPEFLRRPDDKTAEEKAQDLMNNRDRTGDQAIGQQAVGEEDARRAFNDLLPAINKAITGLDTIGEAAVRNAAKLDGTTKGTLSNTQQPGSILDSLVNFGQPTTGTPGQ